jgi:predicted RecB family endonuclease
VTDDASARGKNNRRKGHTFERTVAAMLRTLGLEARRTIQSRGGGKEGADVAIEGPYFIECKTGRAPNIWAAMKQAQRDCEDTGRVPVVLAHREADLPGQRAEEVMVLPMSEGLRLLALDIKRWQAEEPPQ